MTGNLRQAVHDRMAEIAARHAATVYPRAMDGDPAAQFLALLTDTALACLMETEADLAGPGPGQSLAAAAGLTAQEALLTGLAENLDLKNGNPATAPINGWLAWRTTSGLGTPSSLPDTEQDQP